MTIDMRITAIIERLVGATPDEILYQMRRDGCGTRACDVTRTLRRLDLNGRIELDPAAVSRVAYRIKAAA